MILTDPHSCVTFHANAARGTSGLAQCAAMSPHHPLRPSYLIGACAAAQIMRTELCHIITCRMMHIAWPTACNCTSSQVLLPSTFWQARLLHAHAHKCC